MLVLPNSAGIPFVVAATDLIATLPSRIVKGLLPMSNVRMLTPPLPDVEVSPHMFWHRRTDADPLMDEIEAFGSDADIAAIVPRPLDRKCFLVGVRYCKERLRAVEYAGKQIFRHPMIANVEESDVAAGAPYFSGDPPHRALLARCEACEINNIQHYSKVLVRFLYALNNAKITPSESGRWHDVC